MAVGTGAGSTAAWTVVSFYSIYLPSAPKIPVLHPWCKQDFGKLELGVGEKSIPWVSKHWDPARWRISILAGFEDCPDRAVRDSVFALSGD